MKDIRNLFREAAAIDPDLGPNSSKRTVECLKHRMIGPEPWDRQRLFNRAARGGIYLTSDFPSPIKRRCTTPGERADQILGAMRRSRLSRRIRTRSPSGQWNYYSPRELADKWQRGRAVFNVTDFHFEQCALGNLFDTRELSSFNLFPLMDPEVGWIEMMTLVISSAGGFSDSHSDDCDGSNHCFSGRKLWLAWDTREGIAAGLEDLDQQNVRGKCAFDLDIWLTLPSARWFEVRSGQTLFMPGHLSHKVITLEPYLGLGSFYLGFPNLARTLSRWQSQTPNWQRLSRASFAGEVYAEVLHIAEKKRQQLSRTSLTNQQRWGLPHLSKQAGSWLNSLSETASKINSGTLSAPA